MALLTADNLRRLHRDAQCAADVKQMEEMGKFPVEFRVFGTACVNADGEIFYRSAEDEEKLYELMQKMRFQNMYFTPIVTHALYEKASKDEQAQIMYDTKYALMRQMKQDYEGTDFFTRMKPFFDTTANNNGYALLEAFRERIDGYFDDAQVQLFVGMLDMAFDAKILSYESYLAFKVWVDDVLRQMEDVPFVEEMYKRTFYGFVYDTGNGKPKVFCDARKMTVVHKREALMLKGQLVGTIVKRRYSFSDMQALSGARDSFKSWLLELEDASYLSMISELKAQVGVIDESELELVKDAIKNDLEAYRAVCFYEALWNKK